MDLTKMTKDELIEKIQEQAHLAEAVEAKDKEISQLQKEIEEIKKNNLKQVIEFRKITDVLKGKNAEFEKNIINNEALVKSAANLDEENKRLLINLNLYVEAFRNTLKAQQGVLDNAIQLDTFISESLRRK